MGPNLHTTENAVVPDTSEKIKISPVALLKMLKHCKYYSNYRIDKVGKEYHLK